MLRHKRTVHGADDEELADEHNESDYDDGMDSDQEEPVSEKEEEEASEG